MRDFDDNAFPLAYLITFRCYGTWLHGDERGSFRRGNGISYTWAVAPEPNLLRAETKQLKHPPVTLNGKQRAVVSQALREVCRHREYLLLAVNVRTNHAHTVVSAVGAPEPILNTFKAYSTRALREAGLISAGGKPWSRHGSTIYLWKERHVEKAVEYVLLGQGGELPIFD